MTEPLTGLDEAVEAACSLMHDAYERAAVGAGWETNRDSREPWADVPDANQATMRAAVRALLGWDGLAAAVRADERAKVLAEVDAAIVAERDKLIDGSVRAGANAARLAVRALGSCPTCSGPSRETVGMVCQTCGTDYGTKP